MPAFRRGNDVNQAYDTLRGQADGRLNCALIDSHAYSVAGGALTSPSKRRIMKKVSFGAEHGFFHCGAHS
jgi:hypothetical protein